MLLVTVLIASACGPIDSEDLSSSSPSEIEIEVSFSKEDADEDSDEELEDFELIGIIEALSDDSITVSGFTFVITDATELDEGLRVGVEAKVEFIVLEGPVLVALEVETDAEDDSFEDDPSVCEAPPESLVSTCQAAEAALDNAAIVCSAVVDEETMDFCEDAVDDAEEACDELPEAAEKVCDDAADALEDAAEDALVDLDDDGGDENNSGSSQDDDDAFEEIRFTGTVQSKSSGSWQIGGKTVIITSDTEIRDEISVGDEVEVRALEHPDGTIEAERIELED